MIEILDGVFYDPTKEWFEQPQELIELATQIEQTTPIGLIEETDGDHTRFVRVEWESTTECGTFNMHIEFNWLYSIDSNAFLSKFKHDSVTITKIS